jgi:hypothetical protein
MVLLVWDEETHINPDRLYLESNPMKIEPL